jgi:hypothetical protein
MRRKRHDRYPGLHNRTETRYNAGKDNMTKGQQIAGKFAIFSEQLRCSKEIDAAIAEAVREARPPRCQVHKYVVPSLNSICEICDHEEAVAYAVSRTKDKCADAAEAALQAAPDYEAMHTMVRAAIMQVGNDKVSGSESAAPTVRPTTATAP